MMERHFKASLSISDGWEQTKDGKVFAEQVEYILYEDQVAMVRLTGIELCKENSKEFNDELKGLAVLTLPIHGVFWFAEVEAKKDNVVTTGNVVKLGQKKV